MVVWLILPFALQAFLMLFDECYFHIKRGLPKWERIGHPLDTLSILLCFLFTLLFPFSSGALKVYIGLGVISCLCVTKDEFVHKHHCPAEESWLHALLFTLHPVLIIVFGLMWIGISSPNPPLWLLPFVKHVEFVKLFMKGQIALTVLFLSYQILYWNVLWKEKTKT